MKKLYIIFLVIAIHRILYAENKPLVSFPFCITDDFDTFIEKNVDPLNVESFKKFCDNINKSALKKGSFRKKITGFHVKEGSLEYLKNRPQLIELGSSSMQVRKPEMYKKHIKPYLDSPNKRTVASINTFLYYCGLYEWYLQQRSSFHRPVLEQVRRYANEFKNKVVSFTSKYSPAKFFRHEA